MKTLAILSVNLFMPSRILRWLQLLSANATISFCRWDGTTHKLLLEHWWLPCPHNNSSILKHAGGRHGPQTQECEWWGDSSCGGLRYHFCGIFYVHIFPCISVSMTKRGPTMYNHSYVMFVTLLGSLLHWHCNNWYNTDIQSHFDHWSELNNHLGDCPILCAMHKVYHPLIQ